MVLRTGLYEDETDQDFARLCALVGHEWQYSSDSVPMRRCRCCGKLQVMYEGLWMSAPFVVNFEVLEDADGTRKLGYTVRPAEVQ